MDVIGRRVWAIPEGYIPSDSVSQDSELVSHETACVLNVSDQDAHIAILIYFEDRDPVGPYNVVVPARRTRHFRFNDLVDPAPVPRDTPYASVLESDQPVIIQHTRLDSREPAIALLSTVAFGATRF